jgi:hypothetical protein
VDKVEVVALMAATIHSARAAGPTDQAGYARVAEESWALYNAVEAESARRHSRERR